MNGLENRNAEMVNDESWAMDNDDLRILMNDTQYWTMIMNTDTWCPKSQDMVRNSTKK